MGLVLTFQLDELSGHVQHFLFNFYNFFHLLIPSYIRDSKMVRYQVFTKER